MIDGLSVLGLIPARAGSKGIKNKNITDLAGKPLIAYTIEAAKQSKYIDAVVVSTDGDNIAEIAKKWGAEVPFIRPTILADDHSKTLDVVIHAIDVLKSQNREYDILSLLQPTAPLRSGIDIDNALQEFTKHGNIGLASVKEIDESPILMRTINLESFTLQPILSRGSTCRRQDMPKYYLVNGAIYINMINDISETCSFNDNPVPYIMSKSHSIDIDNPEDLLEANTLLNYMSL